MEKELKYDEFKEFINKQTKTDRWERCSVDHIEVKPLANNPICLESIKEDLNLKCSDNKVLQAMETSGLVIRYPSISWNNEVVRETAIKTIFNRAGLSGSVFRKTSPEDDAAMLNLALKYWGCNALVLVRDEMVTAVHAGDPADYSILPVDGLIEALERQLKENFGGYTFQSSIISDDYYVANYLPDNSSEIIKKLNTQLNYLGAESIVKYRPCVKFISSDTGLSAAKIYSCLSNGTKTIMIGCCEELTHKNRHTVADFEAICSRIYSIYMDVSEKLVELAKIRINNPEGCFRLVCKKIRLPKTASLEACEMFSVTRNDEVTAYDIYWALWNVISILQGISEDSLSLLSYEESIAKTTHPDIWTESDKTFEWE